MTSDFSVKITVRNGRLVAAIRKHYGTAAALSNQTGIQKSLVYGLLSMKVSPVLKSGDWSKAAYDISSALRMEPEEIWPAAISRIKLHRNEAELDMSADELEDMMLPGRYGPAMKALSRWSSKISTRNMRALVMSANGATLDDIGKHLKVSRGRADQIVKIATRRIRQNAARDGITKVEDVEL